MKPSKLGIFRQCLAALISSLAVIIVGNLIGWPSPVLAMIRETGKPMTLTSTEISWMVSIIYLGNFLSPLPSGWIMDKIGRRSTLISLAILPLTTWILIYFAKDAYMLYAARILAGMWIGVVSTVMPLYLAEIAEPRVRGSLGTIIQLTANLGILMIYIIGSVVNYEMLAVSCGSIPVIYVLTFSFMPESPYWLLTKNKRDKAANSYKWLRGQKSTDKVEEEVNFSEQAVLEEMSKKGKGYCLDLITNHGIRRALITSVCLGVMQRMSGISVLLAYTSITLPQGIGMLTIDDCVIVMGSVLLLSVFVAMVLIDNLGRKPLLVMSSIFCGLSMFTAGLWFFLNTKTSINVSKYYWVPFASFIAYCFAFSIGLGPVPGIMQGELFPSYIRGLASGITAEFFALASLITNKIYQPMGDNMGFYFNYWMYSTDCFIAAFFICLYVIETKRKTLFEIQEDLN